MNFPPQANPLLVDRFPYWFPSDDRNACSKAFGPSAMRELLENHKDAYFRENASWRRMLVQQPPVQSLGWLKLTEVQWDCLKAFWWDLPLEEVQGGSGLRMDVLYDLAMGTSGEENKNRYFRVCWRRFPWFGGPFSPGMRPRGPQWPVPSLQDFPDCSYTRLLGRAVFRSEIVFDTWDSFVDRERYEQSTHQTWQSFQFPSRDRNLDCLLERRILKREKALQMSMMCSLTTQLLPDD